MFLIAVWTPGKIFNLTWTSREYSPVNTWKNVTNSNLLDSYLARAIGVVLGRSYVQLVNEDLGYVMSLLELVSCACGVDRNTTNIDCFAFLSDVGYLAREITQVTAFNGRLTSSSTQVGSITVCSACLDQRTSGITVRPLHLSLSPSLPLSLSPSLPLSLSLSPSLPLPLSHPHHDVCFITHISLSDSFRRCSHFR
jgi:hypothetical protein